jgi:hypothetical protein
MAAAITLTVPHALAATGQVASSSTATMPPSQDEDSREGDGHEVRASLASRHPYNDGPPTGTHHRRPADPARGRLAVALRDRSASRTGRDPYGRNPLSRCLADCRCSDRHNPGNPTLATGPAVRARSRLVRHYSAPGTSRLRRSNDLLQPRQDSYHPVDSSSTVRRTSPALVPSRHHRRRFHYQSSHTHVRMLGPGRRCPSRHASATSFHPRRHTPTALQSHQRV